MALSSSDAKTTFLAFGKDLKRIADDLYEAVSEEIPPEKKAAAVDAARKKVAAYEELLSQLSARQKEEASDRFGRHVDAIKEDLPKATGG